MTYEDFVNDHIYVTAILYPFALLGLHMIATIAEKQKKEKFSDRCNSKKYQDALRYYDNKSIPAFSLQFRKIIGN